MRTAGLAAVLFLIFCSGLFGQVCADTDQDRLTWARERMHPGITREQLQEVRRWLINATNSCGFNGDLWYYRGLVDRQLKDSPDMNFSFSKAMDKRSAEQTRRFDPFQIVAGAAAVPPGLVREKYALVIGVANFEKSDDFLQYSSMDARAVKSALVKSANFKDQNVTLLVDEKATAENIRLAFGDIHERAKPEDLVLVYISSHGRAREYDPTGISYVLTYDTDTKTTGAIYASALKMVELAEFGRFILAHDYVLLLDTCYSGNARPGGGDADATFDPLQGLAGSGHRVVISASRADEKSYEDPASKHGFFTRFLLDALAKPQPVSALFDYLNTQVNSAVSKIPDRQQHPVMQAYGEGKSIVLNSPLSAPSVMPTAYKATVALFHMQR